MKAEDFINNESLSNKWLKELTEIELNHLSNILEDYAKDQIEKDRERIKKAYYNETDSSDFNSMLKNTPIILD